MLLNNPPYEQFYNTEFKVLYEVGQSLWTTFPLMHDIEMDGAAPWTLVSYDYIAKT